MQAAEKKKNKEFPISYLFKSHPLYSALHAERAPSPIPVIMDSLIKIHKGS